MKIKYSVLTIIAVLSSASFCAGAWAAGEEEAIARCKWQFNNPVTNITNGVKTKVYTCTGKTARIVRAMNSADGYLRQKSTTLRCAQYVDRCKVTERFWG